MITTNSENLYNEAQKFMPGGVKQRAVISMMLTAINILITFVLGVLIF